MEWLIFTGIGVNILGALYLVVQGIRYWHLFARNRQLTTRMEELKIQWSFKRSVGYGTMIGGAVTALVGCLL